MFKKILVCVDGSECALAAARAGAAIARRQGAEIIALNVFYPALASVAEMGAWAVAIDEDEVDRCARQEMYAVLQSIDSVFDGLETPHKIIQEKGHPIESILAVAEREDVDLIIVGSRGLKGIKELFLGSVSSAVMHHACCPVMIVRGNHFPNHIGEFEHILLASDGSNRAQKAATVAVGMAQTFAAPLTVLNVAVDLSSILVAEEEESNTAMTADLCAKRQLDLVRFNVNLLAEEAGICCSYVQKGGHPYDAIVRYADDHDADLIVLGSRGLGGFQQMLVGSVSNYVAHHAGCPVLIVH